MLDAALAFFVLGAFAKLVNIDLRLPAPIHDAITAYLLLAIGIKGSAALVDSDLYTLIDDILLVLAMGALLPLLAFAMLRYFGSVGQVDAAAIAAHYGSVSVATYAIAVAVMDSAAITYEAHLPLLLVILEVPAIFVGLWLARAGFLKGLGAAGSAGLQSHGLDRETLREILLNKGVVLLLAGIAIGTLIHGNGDSALKAFFTEPFKGVLAFFLLDMGVMAANCARELKQRLAFLVSFGIAMPLLGAVAGFATAALIGLSAGGSALLAVLGASASYIAVPAALRQALPQANGGMAIAVALGVTFPFNVMVGIPLYLHLAQLLA